VLATLGLRHRLRQETTQGNRPRSLASIVLLGLTFGTAALPIARSPLPAFNHFSADSGRAVEFDTVIERVRSEPREVLAQPLDAVVLAGRPILYEPTIFGILYGDRRWDAGPLLHRICRREIGLLVIDFPIEGGGHEIHGYALWPAPILAALREMMTFEAEQAGRFLYALHPGARGGACTAPAA
jgi:hypothetical protein